MAWLDKRFYIALASGLGVAFLVLLLRHFGGLQALELKCYDALLMVPSQDTYESPVVLIGETEADIKRFGHPLSDAILADALETLRDYQARVIGVDKYRDIPVAPGSERLNQLLLKLDNLVWIYFLKDGTGPGIALPAVLHDQNKGGVNNLPKDPDGIVRRALLFQDDENGGSVMSFPLMLALTYLEGEKIQAQGDAENNLQLNKVSFKRLQGNNGGYADIDVGGYQFMLRYPHLHKPYPIFTLSDLRDGKISKSQISGKIVLIGGMAKSLGDNFLLPDGRQVYGVEQHAHIIEQLIKSGLQDYPNMNFWPENAEMVWFLFWSLVGSFGSFWRDGLIRLGLLLIAPLALSASAFLSFQSGLWLPWLPAFLAWFGALVGATAWFYLLERVERRQLMRLFEGQVSPQVASLLWDSRQAFFTDGRVNPEQLTATVMFTDLVGFTTLSEKMPPAELMDWLNLRQFE
jgi:adenylate cyclase